MPRPTKNSAKWPKLLLRLQSLAYDLRGRGVADVTIKITMHKGDPVCWQVSPVELFEPADASTCEEIIVAKAVGAEEVDVKEQKRVE